MSRQELAAIFREAGLDFTEADWECWCARDTFPRGWTEIEKQWHEGMLENYRDEQEV